MVLTARVGQEAVKGGPAEDRGFQRCPGVGQCMEAVAAAAAAAAVAAAAAAAVAAAVAAGQGEEGGRADHSNSGSAGCSHLAPVVHRLTSKQKHNDWLGQQ